MSGKVDWIKWAEGRPEETGTYLTFWSDGALETFTFDEDYIERKQVIVGSDVLLYWAENVVPPEGYKAK